MNSDDNSEIRYAYFQRVSADAKRLGFDFRINDLDDSIEIFYEGQWQRLTDILLAIIRTDLRELNYGKKGKGGIDPAVEALKKLAHKQRYNPIKAYFEGLKGKYQPHPGGEYVIPGFAKYFGNPDRMFGIWLFKWMVGTIAKAFKGERNPMLVLVGSQGLGKSWFARWICPVNPDYHFIEASIKPDNKDDILRLADVLVWEVAELGATTKRADVESLKAFITRRFIRVRPPHGRNTIEKPVLCSFIGSVNKDGAGFLNDPTGSTRFLTCEIDRIDHDYSKINVDLLWAEAYWYYKNVPDSWKLTPEEKVIQQALNEQYEQVNELEEVIKDAFEFTGNPKDFISGQELRNHLVIFGYSASGGQWFFRDLNRVMQKLGANKGRSAYKEGQPHQHGWTGVRKVETTKLL